MRGDADVQFVLTVLPRPFPHLAELLLVQVLREVFVEQRLRASAPAAGPGRPFQDVFFFCLVGIGARRDPCLNQIVAQRRVERRCVIRLLKQISLAHPRGRAPSRNLEYTPPRARRWRRLASPALRASWYAQPA